MKWEDVGEMNCSVARTLSVIGDRWTMLIIRNAFMGTRRFADFQAQLGMTKHLLSDRLKRLVEMRVFKKVAYQHGRYEYRFTPMGRALYPILLAMTAWGDAWLDEGNGAPLLYVHKGCGQQMTPTMSCSECGEPVTVHDVIPTPGPGLITSKQA
ncbi:winged helix-turn-helix transcriptional regulator [Alcanivorax sp. IL3]|uniref:winged helix-turn-helix transcriptional regulator n=1 Tax=unclassified Alcanivorax TaxID=2638842 RepID=UPI0039C29051